MIATRTKPLTRKLTPPEVAAELGVSPNKVVAWIVAGELKAMNGATRRSGRRRYLIDRADLESFEAARAVVPAVAPVHRRRKHLPQGVTEFF